MFKLKSIIFYLSILLIGFGIVQAAFFANDLRKIILLKRFGVEVKGVVADKFITERTESFQSGYTLKFNSDTLNKIYNHQFFFSYNSHSNYGDSLSIVHYPANPKLSRLSNTVDFYNDTSINLFCCLLLLLVGWLGLKNADRLLRFLIES